MAETKIRNEQLKIEGGWIASNETWTYASADDPTFTFTISGDKTGKYSVGMRIKLTQTTAKYFIITAVSYSDPNTTVTVYGGTDYDLANEAITSPYYSMVKAPHGFPLDPLKWTVTGSGYSSQSEPVSGTTYNIGGYINVPVGAWSIESYGSVVLRADLTTFATYIYIELSLGTTTSNSDILNMNGARYYLGSGGEKGRRLDAFYSFKKNVSLTTKDTYYLNATGAHNGTGNSLAFNFRVLQAVCAYL